jgi:ubiquitin carboxyl-terminal hydrolase 1
MVERKQSSCILKQITIARAPEILCLHLSRSMLLYGTSGKNTCQVIFPELLDLTDLYTIHGWQSNSIHSDKKPSHTFDSHANVPRTLYRLCAVVEHLGNHAGGHFITYRRVPVSVLERALNLKHGDLPPDHDRWFYVSDKLVQPTTLSKVLSAEAYMLFYEKI